ncbi:helix-turn-helix domain-containing protein [Actinokineospora xionganensis]|uniref:Helix-turn-helix transcriptional regulator n=1 Tax=Actinokineospora xionganensis TaxID=2684470 RepID=A0ABR7L259_9PSEU|nr:helix-turn-helix transcriptional regulator [Actinokineospora xionganensis]MBC6446770.1 helix-turn-helix transcriptional regulator [Actinokineospora xionganensis]
MGTHQSPPFQRRMLGKKLRELREGAGLKAAEVARRTEISTGRLSRIENGEVAPDIPLAKFLLDLYVIPVNDWEPYLEQVRAARRAKGWWQAYGVAARGFLALETAATTVRTFQLAYMPGLLQTEDHIRAVFQQLSGSRGRAWIDNQVRVRMIRQQRLHATDDQLVLATVIDHTVLRREVGSREVMQAQLHHLIEMAALPNVTLQVMPAEAGTHVGMDGAFTVLSFPGANEPDLAYIENVAGSFQIEKKSRSRPVQSVSVGFSCRPSIQPIRSP